MSGEDNDGDDGSNKVVMGSVCLGYRSLTGPLFRGRILSPDSSSN